MCQKGQGGLPASSSPSVLLSPQAPPTLLLDGEQTAVERLTGHSLAPGPTWAAVGGEP